MGKYSTMLIIEIKTSIYALDGVRVTKSPFTKCPIHKSSLIKLLSEENTKELSLLFYLIMENFRLRFSASRNSEENLKNKKQRALLL